MGWCSTFMSEIPSGDILESLYKLIIRESAQLKTVLELYDMEIHQKISMPNYQKLKTMLKRSADQKLRLQNFDARHGRIERGAVVKKRREWVALKEEKVSVTSGKKEAECSKGDQCSFRHESNDRAHRPDHNAATASEPSSSRGRSVSNKRSVQVKSNHGAILRQPCRYDLKVLARDHFLPPECQFYNTETGCKAGWKCLFPASWGWWTTKQKAKERLLFTQKKRKRRQECCIVTIVPQMDCVSKESDALVTQQAHSPWETRCKKCWDRFEKIRFTPSTLRQARIQEKKGLSLGKIQVKHAMKFEDRSHEETERRNSPTTQSMTRLCSIEKKNANDCMTSTWQEPSRIQRYSSQSTNKTVKRATIWRQRKTLTTPLTRTQVGDSTDSREETCKHLRQDRGPNCKQLCHRRQRGTKPSVRRACGILSILQAPKS